MNSGRQITTLTLICNPTNSYTELNMKYAKIMEDLPEEKLKDPTKKQILKGARTTCSRGLREIPKMEVSKDFSVKDQKE